MKQINFATPATVNPRSRPKGATYRPMFEGTLDGALKYISKCTKHALTNLEVACVALGVKPVPAGEAIALMRFR